MKSQMLPRITVITISYNSAATIEKTIKCYRTDYSNIEFIVIDGNSTDGTTEILCRDKIDILRIEPDKGIYDAMNKSIKLSSGSGHVL